MKIVFHFKTKCTFVYDESGRYYRRGVGITKLIKKWFFHNKWSLQSCSGSSGGGADLGRRIDKEMQVWTNAVVKGSKQIDKKVAKFCQQSKLLIAEFKKRGWTPVSAQRLVGCYSSGLSTRCDLVLRDMVTSELVLIEIKSGYSDSFDDEEGKAEHDFLKKPFDNLCANPRRFAMIQLLLTWILHSTTYKNVKLKHSNVLVAHVTHERAKLYTIPPTWALEVQKRIAEEMKNRNTRYTKRSASYRAKHAKRKHV